MEITLREISLRRTKGTKKSFQIQVEEWSTGSKEK